MELNQFKAMKMRELALSIIPLFEHNMMTLPLNMKYITILNRTAELSKSH